MPSLGTEIIQAPYYSSAADAPGARFQQRPLPSRSNHFRLRQGLFVTADLCGIMSGALLAITLRFPEAGIPQTAHANPLVPRAPIAEHLGVAFLYAVLIVLFCNTQKLYAAYQSSSLTKEFEAIVKSVFMATVLLGGCLFVTGIKTTSRLIVAATAVSAVVTMFGWRQFRRRSIRRAIADGVSCHNVLIVGADGLAQAVARHLALHRQFGFMVVGHLSTGVPPGDLHEKDIKIIGTVDQLKDLCRTHFIDEIVVCAHDRQTVMQVISDARECGAGVRVIPDLYDGLAWGAQLDYLGDFPTMAVVQRPTQLVALITKRILDVVLSAVGLAVLSPVLLLLAIIVQLDSPGPILYVSRRVGKKGRVFPCYKFRTMVANADHLRNKLEHLNERDGILFKITTDPRITRFGLFMRKHSLDELPQLWNVLKGDMSLVGPRPPLVTEVEQYQLEYLRRLEVAPGITGLWQVEARNNPSFDRYISLDLRYIEDWSLTLDLQILLRTVAVVFAGTGS